MKPNKGADFKPVFRIQFVLNVDHRSGIRIQLTDTDKDSDPGFANTLAVIFYISYFALSRFNLQFR
jgi:hypothetical protein